MIFNPYELTTISSTVTTAAELPWAVAQLGDNCIYTVATLVFLAADLLACCPKGVMRHQLLWIIQTQKARTFESSLVIFPWLKPVLLAQYFLFFGLTLFCLADASSDAFLLHPLSSAFPAMLLPAMGAMLVWFLLQRWLVNWGCYLYDLNLKHVIFGRAYDAAFVLLAPLVTLCFVAFTADVISADLAAKLLAALFILSQISFIFNGIKIFYDGFFSILLIIVYLCTLEIAPLWIFWARLTPI